MTTTEPTAETSTIVRALLDAAGLTVSDDELAGFVRMYPILRSQSDALYRLDMEPEAPALHFDPTVPYG